MRMKTPSIQGSYRSAPVEQGGPKGPFEDRLVATGGQSILGNAKARDVGAGGPGAGRDVYRSGAQMEHGSANPGNPPNRPRSNDVFQED